MNYRISRRFTHLAALMLGVFSINWMALGVIVVAHYFISPAIAAQLIDVDFDEIREKEDYESAKIAMRTVNIMTFHSSIFSLVLYFFGLSLNSIF